MTGANLQVHPLEHSVRGLYARFCHTDSHYGAVSVLQIRAKRNGSCKMLNDFFKKIRSSYFRDFLFYKTFIEQSHAVAAVIARAIASATTTTRRRAMATFLKRLLPLLLEAALPPLTALSPSSMPNLERVPMAEQRWTDLAPSKGIQPV